MYTYFPTVTHSRQALVNKGTMPPSGIGYPPGWAQKWGGITKDYKDAPLRYSDAGAGPQCLHFGQFPSGCSFQAGPLVYPLPT